MLPDALSLINRQKAEIERLEGERQEFRCVIDDLSNQVNTAKAEAIKDFAERLKERKYQSSDWSHGEHPYVVEESDIDDVLDEMVGE
jgi:hypothetical protein